MNRNIATIQEKYEVSPNSVKGKKRTLIEGWKKAIAEKQAKIEKIKKDPYGNKDDIAKIERKIESIENDIIDQCREHGLNDMLGNLAQKAEIRNKQLRQMGIIR